MLRSPLAASLGVLAVLAAGLVGLVAGEPVAHADLLPEGKRALDVAVTFVGAIDSHLVAYPTDCMGLDTKLNPHLEFYQDYDVLEQGAPRAPYKFCNEKTRVWALDLGSFKKSPGEKVPAFVRSPWKLDELTRVRTSERGALFRTSPHIHATGYAMPAAGLVDESSPLAKVEELVTLGGVASPRAEGAAHLPVQVRRARGAHVRGRRAPAASARCGARLDVGPRRREARRGGSRGRRRRACAP